MLAAYLVRSFAFSLPGLLFALGALAYYLVFFAPGQRTPDADYFILVLGACGGGLSFLVTLSLTGLANRAESYPFFARLPSRVEYLAAVLLAGVAYATTVQMVLALAAWLVGGVDLLPARVLDIPPLWLALNVLLSVLAMHASDFVSDGWSRASLFGVLLILLFAQNYAGALAGWLAGRFTSLANTFLFRGWLELSTSTQTIANWLYGDAGGRFEQVLTLPFWPFATVLDAVIAGIFRGLEALAPAVLLLYATFLFLLAGGLLARKDLMLVE